MENIQLNTVHQDPEALSSNNLFDWEKILILNQENKASAMDEDENEDSLVDSMLCDSDSRLIPTGFTRSSCTDEVVMFVNAGGDGSNEAESSMKIVGDKYFEGGNVLRTDENIIEAGDYPFLYKSARLGNFYYRFNNLPPGDYVVDLHFAEIININGPKGMRVFNVFVQEEKVLSDFDVFSIVGANKPLQLVDTKVSVKEEGVIHIRFEGVNGSPAVCGICIRKAAEVSVPRVSHEYLKCNSCAAEMEVSSAQKKLMRVKATDKYEKKIQELTKQCQLKTNECHEAWMSLTQANEQLEKVRMELDNKIFQTLTLDQTVGKQTEGLRTITSRYERDKKYWSAAVNELQEKVKRMKQEHSQLSREAHDCADSIPELNKMVTGVQALVAQCEDFKMKYVEEQAKRKELYNQIQETKGNIRVFCRCRPQNKDDISAGCATVLDFDAAKDGDLGILNGGSTKKTFKFDRVYTPKDSQVDVFADASPMVTSVLDGYNVCIFAYGQTGTGKTFTMEGTEQNRGVNYRTLDQLFEITKERSETFTYNISVSVLEVYNEQIRDLLATSPSSKKLEVKQSSGGSHHVPGILEARVNSTREAWNVLQAGSNARAVGSNNVNEHSSRSHCMLCIMVRAKNLINGECTNSKLWLVDLAGSERLARTDVQGERLKEAQNINRSLSALGDVIYALATKSSHIPYRNSKLTHLLQDSLGGDSKTLMFVQISPSEKDLSETLSSLNFATRVRGIELGPTKKQIDTTELQKMKVMLEKARQESRSKEESLRKLEENLQNLENRAKGKDQTYKNQQEKIKELEGQLVLKSNLHSQSEKQFSQLSDRLKGKEELCSNLQIKIKELEAKLRERQQSESATFQMKIKDLENKLKEQEQESQSHSLILQNKIKELETKLKAQEEQSTESFVLRQKIKEVEDKLREQEQQLQSRLSHEFAELIRATPTEGKTCKRDDEVMSEIDIRILRSSNSIKRPMSHGSVLPKGNDYLYETRKKRQSRSGETENNAAAPTSLYDNKKRKSDPPRVARLVRTTKPVTTTQGPPIHKRINKDQVAGIKERDNKKKIWSR
ncbi:kinesin-like protein KIN-14R [Pistacia vera]|uniref:kinesin-like protein KIN-14R n=1 Tax=Pistacia vera TaxID=55513 RepID=UPI001262B579|nr:kinesin-like protein KIN-14R [Pistacia vera]